jgi:hypothetical protein
VEERLQHLILGAWEHDHLPGPLTDLGLQQQQRDEWIATLNGRKPNASEQRPNWALHLVRPHFTRVESGSHSRGYPGNFRVKGKSHRALALYASCIRMCHVVGKSLAIFGRTVPTVWRSHGAMSRMTESSG